MSVVGLYGAGWAAQPDAAILPRMVQEAIGLHPGRAETVRGDSASIAVFPRRDRAAGPDVVERDGTTVIVSGHIFHPEARLGSSAQLVQQLLGSGRLHDGLAECVGEFCIVILDRDAGEVTLVTDYLGVRPLFYAETRSALLFGTSVWPIFQSGLVARRVDYDAMAAWIQCRYPFNGASLFRDISRVPAASIVQYRRGQIAMQRYAASNGGERGSTRDLAEQIDDIVSRTARTLTREEKKVSVLLSGGFDSRYAACVLRKQNVDFSAFTVPVDSAEAELATTVAERLGLELRQTPLSGSLEDAYGYPVRWSAAGFPMGKFVAGLPIERFGINTVVVDGFLGETLIRGDDDEKPIRDLGGRLGSVEAALARSQTWLDPAAVFVSGLAGRIRARVVEQVGRWLKALDEPDERKVVLWLLHNRKTNWIANNHLHYLENAETVHPFFSRELVELRIGRPAGLFRRDLYRGLLDRFHPAVAGVPHSSEVKKGFNAGRRLSRFHQRQVPRVARDILWREWAQASVRRWHLVSRLLPYGVGIVRSGYLLKCVYPTVLLMRRLEEAGVAVKWDEF